jgi:hypothetical protein
VIAVVPLTGSGSFEDPVRPLFADLAVRREGAEDALAISWEPSDDGKFAIAEFQRPAPADAGSAVVRRFADRSAGERRSVPR